MTILTPIRTSVPRWGHRVAAAGAALALAACTTLSTPSPSAAPATATPGGSASAVPSPTAEPTPSIPTLTLPAPASTDSREISYTVDVQLEAGTSGRIVITVVSLTDVIVQELVLRWPTEVRETVFLAPFEPSQQRIREGGPPLVQEWTKWVEGPGAQGEPAGTTSLGWGPLLPGATLTIPVLATRVAAGPLRFDLQILAGEAALTSDDALAWLQVSVP